jgi:uncharacterized protein (TIGR02246 family)
LIDFATKGDDVMKTLAILALALLSTSLQGDGQAKGAAKGQTASGEAAIIQVADSYVKATLAGDAKAIAALYTEDALEMPPNEPIVKGRAAIEQYYTKEFSGPTKVGQFTITHLESRAAGDTAYDVGTYQQSMTPPGQTAATSDTGKYVVILKRTGGSWKVAYAIYNSDQAPRR